MSVYLYTPPTWRNVGMMEGSLRSGVATSTIVYRQNGVWHNVFDQGFSNPDVADCDVYLQPNGQPMTLFFTKPTVIPGDLVTGLQAMTKGDPSWTDATFTLL